MSDTPLLDYNLLYYCANNAFQKGDYKEALAIYLFLATGDGSLEAGWTGSWIAKCYEKLGDLHSAKYWASRACEENPAIEEYVQLKNLFDSVSIDDVVAIYRSAYEDHFGSSKALHEQAARSGRKVWPS